MKIIKWLRKVTQLEPPRKTCAIASTPTNTNQTQSKEVVVPFPHQKVNEKKKRMAKIKLGCKNLNKMFTFSSILNLKTVHAMKMKESMMSDKKLEAEVIATVDVGNTQVVPINDATITSPSTPNAAITSSSTQKCGVPMEKRDQIVEIAITKSFSKIKELMKWAAATKAEKGGKYCIRRKVLEYESRETRKVMTNDDDNGYRISSGSPKISFRWDIESCSFTSSSVFSDTATLSESSSTRSMDDNNNINMSPLSNYSSETRVGNWITTDSEFVVLEL